MSEDKRSVATDAMETLGTIITPAEKRDAIHLAVDNVVAAHSLRPGEDVGFLGDGVCVGICDNPVGIVDPFLKRSVKAGERFWLVVYPRTITSLRHVWTHPAFDDVQTNEGGSAAAVVSVVTSPSEEWLRDYACGLGVSYESLLVHADGYLKYDNYWCEGERFESEYVPDEFWSHYEIVTGRKVEEGKRGSFFSCSC